MTLVNSTTYAFSNDEHANKRRYDTDFDIVGKLLYLARHGHIKTDFNEYVKLLSEVREHERSEMRRERRVGYSLRLMLRRLIRNNTRRMTFVMMSSLVLTAVYSMSIANSMFTFVIGLLLFCFWFVHMFVTFGSE